jgi:hypothetical protein
LHESARRCTPLALFLGLGLLVMACLVLLSLLALVLVRLHLVLETLARQLVESVGVASVASTGCRLRKGVMGLSFCGRVETSFDAFVF